MIQGGKMKHKQYRRQNETKSAKVGVNLMLRK